MRPTGAELAGALPQVQFGQEGLQEGGGSRRLGGGDGSQRALQFRPRQDAAFLLAPEELPNGFCQHIRPAGVAVLPLEGVKGLGQGKMQADIRPVLRYLCRTGDVRLMGPPVPGLLHGCSNLHMRPMPVAYVAQAAGSTNMPDTPLLVASPSNVRLDPVHGDAAKASASPSSPPGSASGSNSIAVCQCGGQFEVRHRSDDLPYHPDPNAPVIGPRLRQICHGSGRRAHIFAEA